MSYELISYPDYLAHYGIKGQKWGVRRFQNKDGSLTAAGKEHYGSGNRTERAFNKESKKLEKLKRDADLTNVMDKWQHHDDKARKAGKVAIAGASTAALGAMTAVGARANRDSLNSKVLAVQKGNNLSLHYKPLGDDLQLVGLGVAAGGAAVAIGALGKAAYHQMMKKSADRKVRAIERGTADLRVQKQINKMTKMFADTPYSELIGK